LQIDVCGFTRLVFLTCSLLTPLPQTRQGVGDTDKASAAHCELALDGYVPDALSFPALAASVCVRVGRGSAAVAPFPALFF
jgi:hypothetical protein